ncbi:VTC domain-containing protein [Sediminihabitans luteus]|uniref:VTC domain-containing protein n=1 Tax=Sediminihabitans luteus TaxID=1138585 RepID=A0A2M9D0K7_9CELL|nr:polyphosphate polymerase domain-containing protein [Sediminihabitans luteus]PJJ77726.1 VTC domain-containing protein [Sediminihabitans luteus]GIJ00047.1 VTC domain-containing protein [Sediminihabitans luteus]
MRAPGTHVPLAGFAPITIDELVTQAALLTRVDRKYVVPVAALDVLLGQLARSDADDAPRALDIGGERSFGYASVYFDTVDRDSYHRSAHRRRRRFKVRTRTYVDTAECWLEVKTRGPRGTTVKQRAPHAAAPDALPDDGRAFVAATLAGAGVPGVDVAGLVPVLETRYHRSTVLLPATSSRVTIDTGLTFVDRAADDVPAVGTTGMAVVETKTGSTPSAFDRALWAAGHRPVRISKFGSGLAVLHPELPAAPWRRVIDRHLLPGIAPAAHAA